MCVWGGGECLRKSVAETLKIIISDEFSEEASHSIPQLTSSLVRHCTEPHSSQAFLVSQENHSKLDRWNFGKSENVYIG